MSSEQLSIANGFSGEISSKFNWFLYYIDSFLSVVLFDTVEIIGINFSDLEPVNGISKFWAYILNIFISIGTIDYFLFLLNSFFKEKEFVGTPLEALSKLYHMGFIDSEMEVRGLINDEGLIIKRFKVDDFVGALDITGVYQKGR